MVARHRVISKPTLVQMAGQSMHGTPSINRIGSAMEKAERDALEGAVRGIIERAVAALEAIGMSHEGALALLMIQSAIRINDAAEVRRLLQSIGDMLDDD